MKLHSSDETGFLLSSEASQSLHALLPRQSSTLAPGGLGNGPHEPHWEKCSVQSEGHSHLRYFRAKHEHPDYREHWLCIHQGACSAGRGSE